MMKTAKMSKPSILVSLRLVGKRGKTRKTSYGKYDIFTVYYYNKEGSACIYY